LFQSEEDQEDRAERQAEIFDAYAAVFNREFEKKEKEKNTV